MRIKLAAISLILATCPGAVAAKQPALPALTRLAELSAQRLLLADTVAASKRHSGKPVEDAARESEQLERLGAQAASHGLTEAQATAFFKAQMEANKLVQYRLLAEPAHRAAAAVDLGPVRERLDRLNVELLDALAPAMHEAQGEACVLRTDRVQRLAARRHRLDALHRTALVRAFGDLCRMP
ncbi:chorismate mutase, putative [Lysobacter antibioticus]|uniref:gamma subclass chorismate mutase AroQ n=1 Tax=Lysobacter antibioticus TaxID=84531 RepID=UPI0007171417|nr:gamma subclass chorismate mutase AroQ [Lysobacter antibioticus]ALN63654.1 chorismate mutase, putative [Lysobacter antibioticus]